MLKQNSSDWRVGEVLRGEEDMDAAAAGGDKEGEVEGEKLKNKKEGVSTLGKKKEGKMSTLSRKEGNILGQIPLVDQFPSLQTNHGLGIDDIVVVGDVGVVVVVAVDVEDEKENFPLEEILYHIWVLLLSLDGVVVPLQQCQETRTGIEHYVH
jgi:hypothetical protein